MNYGMMNDGEANVYVLRLLCIEHIYLLYSPISI